MMLHCATYPIVTHTLSPEFKVSEIGGGEAGEVKLGHFTDLFLVVVAVRGGAADELTGRIRTRMNPLT